MDFLGYFFLAILIFFIVGFLGSWNNSDSYESEEETLAQLKKDFINDVNKILNKKTSQDKIVSAYRQLVSTNAFGEKNYERFEKELISFLKKKSKSHKQIESLGHTYEFDSETVFSSMIQPIEKLINKFDADLSFDSEMSPYEYEIFCAEQFKKNGWKAEATQASSDQGVDVIAFKAGNNLVAQCKLYSKAVGNSAVQEITAGMNFYKADIGVVIAPNGFTKSAIKLAEANKIKLLHHTEIKDI